MNSLSTITVMPENKQQQATFIENVKQEILSGNYDVIELYARIDFIKKTLDLILKENEVKEALNDALSNWSEKVISVGSFDVEKRSRSTYDCSVDMEYNRLKAALKARESFLKANKCNEDGEAIPINKTDYIAIKAR